MDQMNNTINDKNKVELYDFKPINNCNHQSYIQHSIHNSGNNHTTNHFKNGIGHKTNRKISFRGNGLTLDKRKEINIDAICELIWMLIILTSMLITLYNFSYIEPRCQNFKSTIILCSQIISLLTTIETISFYLIWFFLTNSSRYNMQIIYDSITGVHILTAFINIIFAITTFLSRTCHENKMTTDIDFNNLNTLHQLALRYDLKLAGALHIVLTILISFTAIHLTTKRSKYFLHYLSERGLLIEYIWEVID